MPYACTLGREAAEAIPDAAIELIWGCGHYGYLEDPTAVNKAMVQVFTGPTAG
ncbi:alpha/beta fold hydrolase [Streptomyces gardneri]|uniref:alpha/beta fold hydrolase n=1 Tax=Streptomyces gardneri TaxID=66892 RepID=UPI0033D335D4